LKRRRRGKTSNSEEAGRLLKAAFNYNKSQTGVKVGRAEAGHFPVIQGQAGSAVLLYFAWLKIKKV
jgi:hypothetical protein